MRDRRPAAASLGLGDQWATAAPVNYHTAFCPSGVCVCVSPQVIDGAPAAAAIGPGVPPPRGKSISTRGHRVVFRFREIFAPDARALGPDPHERYISLF
jgi:hypothetical protein